MYPFHQITHGKSHFQHTTLCYIPAQFGDEIDGIVKWDGTSDLSKLSGQVVRLKDADLYAFQFTKAE